MQKMFCTCLVEVNDTVMAIASHYEPWSALPATASSHCATPQPTNSYGLVKQHSDGNVHIAFIMLILITLRELPALISIIGSILSKYTYKCYYIMYVIYITFNIYIYILLKMHQTL